MVEQREGNVTLQADTKMRQAARAMQPIRMSGVVKGLLWLTPPEVQRAGEIRKGPHWSFVLEPMKKARILMPANHGVYMGGEHFPTGCCQCQEPATQVELVEAGMPAARLSSRLRVGTNADPQRVFDAVRDRRVWYAVPFCPEHSLKSECFSFVDSSDRLTTGVWKLRLRIANPDWGRTFGELNGLDGVWMYPFFLGTVRMHDPRDVEALPPDWLRKVALMRLTFFVLAAVALAVAMWTIVDAAGRTGSVDLFSVEVIAAILGLALAVALPFVAGSFGHFPKPKDNS